MNIDKLVLAPEEINDIYQATDSDTDYLREISLATVKKVVEYMGSKCTEHWANSTPFKWRCPECWQALKATVEKGKKSMINLGDAAP